MRSTLSPMEQQRAMRHSGSYAPGDVQFLLKRVELAPTPVAEKERLIQSGRRHYSEMIGHEGPPSPAYLRAFHTALEANAARFARDLIALARLIAEARPKETAGEIALVSLARAGTPVGVLLGRILRERLNRPTTHYSISIIRDRGVDGRALEHILERHSTQSVAFVDGWTAKGVIAAELERAIGVFNEQHGVALDRGLFAVADLCGAASAAATADDYLIPSSLLGAVISGLVSRSILNEEVIGPNDFHGCIYYEHLLPHDLSRWFVDRMDEEIDRQWEAAPAHNAEAGTSTTRDELRIRSEAFISQTSERFGVRSVHHIKPGIGEATRVLLRRVPDRLVLRDADRPETAHLRQLAEEKRVNITLEPNLPYLAAAIIRELKVG